MCPTDPVKMCTNPNTVIWTGKYYLTKDRTSRKKLYYDCDPLGVNLPSDYYTSVYTGDLRPKLEFIGKVSYDKLKHLSTPYILIPCGQCLDCRIQQSRVWADRVVLEAKKYEHNYFVTLTYDDLHLPPNNSLRPDDLSLFMRRLRKRFKGIKIRFFGCGEYGDLSRRCHLHIILFNCPLFDLSYDFMEAYDHEYDSEGNLINVRFRHHLRSNNRGDLRYSPLIHRCWDFKGNISVGTVTYDSAQYVSQYVTKKFKPGMKEYYEKLGIEPEFCRMSTHPGIASDFYYLQDDINLYQDKIIIPSRGGAHESLIPRYFDKLFIKKYGEDLFNNGVRSRRLVLRTRRSLDNVRKGVDLDVINFAKDYKLKRNLRLRKAI